jgi:tetratricopeptide (TPR) repeat protein
MYQDRGEWEQAAQYYEKSLKIKEELGVKQGITNTLNNLGTVYHNRGEWEKTAQYYEKSLKISEELGDRQGISTTLGNIGNEFKDRGEWERATQYFEKSLKIKEELGDKQGISGTLGNIGIVYKDRGEWERATQYFEKSLKISEELGDKQGISGTLCNIGELSIKNGNWDESKNVLEKALKLAHELSPISTVDILSNLGELFRLEEQYDDAFRQLEDALQIVSKVGDKPQEINILEKLGDTHADQYLKEKSDESLSSAEKFYTLAFEKAGNLKMPLQEATALRGIGYVQAKKKDMEASKKSFMKSIETLRRLGAFFELQKTLTEYAKSLFESDNLVEAEMIAKTVAFDAWYNDYKELSVKAYLLLGDIVMKQEQKYGYYLDALKASEFNPKIYIRTCFILIFRMKNMERALQLKFINSLKPAFPTFSYN